MKKTLMTLGYLIKDGRVLLGYKKKGFGQGRWNGFGGKVEAGEDIKAAAAREIIEECGVAPAGLDEGGVLEFKFRVDPAEVFEVYVFRTFDFSGEPAESEEMRPRWFEFENIPFTQMWDDDQYWLKQFLVSGKKVKADFLFDDEDKVIEKKVEFY
jgi:8-oxo-dGTP diphosphatase/2-hydroxy-dATP diphosphatase